MERIDTLADIRTGLDALARIDPRLAPIIATAGPVPLRRSPPGFQSLASIVVSQQVSRASADAIFGRLRALLDPLTPRAVLDGGETALRAAGLSRPKQRTLLAVAEAVQREDLDLHDLCGIDAGAAVDRMVAVHGIGEWTAECYLLFCAGHRDIFPARDLALQAAVGDGLALPDRPSEKTLAALAESWAPWRGVAARLFWAHYARMRGRDGAPVA